MDVHFSNVIKGLVSIKTLVVTMNSTKHVEEFCEMQKNYIPIADFYADQSVFITGGSGFLGKVLIEKLLRSCPKIKNVFVLMRGKKGLDPMSRTKELVNHPIFDVLKRTSPLSLNKIIPVKGDITEYNLGLSEKDENIIIQTVSIVFHSAATVRFDETIRKAVEINLLGTKKIVELCHRIVNLKVLVYVSTAYSNCDKKLVNEVIYEPPIEINNIIKLIDCSDDEILKQMTPELIGSRPNTYTFTKALAENMIAEECRGLPVSIVRPTIVISSHKEPVKGWLDNFNGPTAMIIGVGYGFLRSFNSKNVLMDLIPVDKVTNLIITAAWEKAMSRSIDIKIYCCATGEHNPITIPKFVETCSKHIVKYPFKDVAWWPKCKSRSNILIYSTEDFVYHKLPVYLSKLYSKMTKTPSKVEKIHNKLKQGARILNYFAFNEWIFKSDNTVKLYNKLSVKDKDDFNFDVKNIQWDNYLEDYTIGIRQFVLKQNPTTLPESLVRLNRLHRYHNLLQFFTVILFLFFIFISYKTIQFAMM